MTEVLSKIRTGVERHAQEKSPPLSYIASPNRPHEFQAALTVNLHGERLRLDFRVINPSSGGTFDFTAALHSYIEVVDVERSAVVGLQGLASWRLGGGGVGVVVEGGPRRYCCEDAARALGDVVDDAISIDRRSLMYRRDC